MATPFIPSPEVVAEWVAAEGTPEQKAALAAAVPDRPATIPEEEWEALEPSQKIQLAPVAEQMIREERASGIEFDPASRTWVSVETAPGWQSVATTRQATAVDELYQTYAPDMQLKYPTMARDDPRQQITWTGTEEDLEKFTEEAERLGASAKWLTESAEYIAGEQKEIEKILKPYSKGEAGYDIIAAIQAGVITNRQLKIMGFSPSDVQLATRSARLSDALEPYTNEEGMVDILAAFEAGISRADIQFATDVSSRELDRLLRERAGAELAEAEAEKYPGYVTGVGKDKITIHPSAIALGIVPTFASKVRSYEDFIASNMQVGPEDEWVSKTWYAELSVGDRAVVDESGTKGLKKYFETTVGYQERLRGLLYQEGPGKGAIMSFPGMEGPPVTIAPSLITKWDYGALSPESQRAYMAGGAMALGQLYERDIPAIKEYNVRQFESLPPAVRRNLMMQYGVQVGTVTSEELSTLFEMLPPGETAFIMREEAFEAVPDSAWMGPGWPPTGGQAAWRIAKQPKFWKELGIGMVPFSQFWHSPFRESMGPIGLGAFTALDLLMAGPIVRAAGAGLRAGVTVSKAAGMTLRAGAKAPWTMVRHPRQTWAVGTDPIASIIFPRRVPIESLEVRKGLGGFMWQPAGGWRFPVAPKMTREPFLGFPSEARELLMGGAILGGRAVMPTPTPGELRGLQHLIGTGAGEAEIIARLKALKEAEAARLIPRWVEPPLLWRRGPESPRMRHQVLPIQSVLGPAVVHGTDISAWARGAVIGERGLDVAPTIYSRFAVRPAKTGPPHLLPGGLIMRDPEILGKLRASTKRLFERGIEVEARIPSGVSVGAPSQFLFARGPMGELLTFPVTPGISFLERTGLKFRGMFQTPRQFFKPAIETKPIDFRGIVTSAERQISEFMEGVWPRRKVPGETIPSIVREKGPVERIIKEGEFIPPDATVIETFRQKVRGKWGTYQRLSVPLEPKVKGIFKQEVVWRRGKIPTEIQIPKVESKTFGYKELGWPVEREITLFDEFGEVAVGKQKAILGDVFDEDLLIRSKLAYKHPTLPGKVQRRVTGVVTDNEGRILLTEDVMDPKGYLTLPGGQVDPLGAIGREAGYKGITVQGAFYGQILDETGVATGSFSQLPTYLGKTNRHALKGVYVVEGKAGKPRPFKLDAEELRGAIWWDGRTPIEVSPATYDILRAARNAERVDFDLTKLTISKATPKELRRFPNRRSGYRIGEEELGVGGRDIWASRPLTSAERGFARRAYKGTEPEYDLTALRSELDASEAKYAKLAREGRTAEADRALARSGVLRERIGEYERVLMEGEAYRGIELGTAAAFGYSLLGPKRWPVSAGLPRVTPSPLYPGTTWEAIPASPIPGYPGITPEEIVPPRPPTPSRPKYPPMGEGLKYPALIPDIIVPPKPPVLVTPTPPGPTEPIEPYPPIVPDVIVPVPPPVIPEGDEPPPVVPILLFPSGEKEKEKRVWPPGTVVFKMGGLEITGEPPVEPVWKVIPPPYDAKKPITIFEVPEGAHDVAPGKGSAKASLQVIGGPAPRDIRIDLGIADIYIKAGGTEIEFVGGGLKTDIGERIESPAMGMTIIGEPWQYPYGEREVSRRSPRAAPKGRPSRKPRSRGPELVRL